MKCPECNGRGETIYYEEVDRDENTVTVVQRKGICRICNGSGEKPFTNADRIRAMSDEELATFLADDDRVCPPVHQNCSRHVHDCVGCHLGWLQQPAKEETNGPDEV